MGVRTVVFWLITLIAIAVTSSAQAQQEATQLQRILERGTLRVAVFHQDFAPFFWMDEKSGELKGVDIELARGIAQELGVQVEFNRSATSFNQMVDMVAVEEVDMVISLLSATLPRAKKVLFTKPYVTLRSGLLVNKVRMTSLPMPPGMNIVQYMKEKGVPMAERRGTSYESWTRELFPKAEITLADEWADTPGSVVDMVENGKVVAVFCDETDIKKIKFQQPKLALKLQTILFEDKIDPIAIALPATSVHFLSWINDYLNKKNINYNVDDLMKMYPEIFAQK